MCKIKSNHNIECGVKIECFFAKILNKSIRTRIIRFYNDFFKLKQFNKQNIMNYKNIIYIYIKEKLIIDCFVLIKKYRSLKNNRKRLFKQDVSGEILLLSIAIF